MSKLWFVPFIILLVFPRFFLLPILWPNLAKLSDTSTNRKLAAHAFYTSFMFHLSQVKWFPEPCFAAATLLLLLLRHLSDLENKTGIKPFSFAASASAAAAAKSVVLVPFQTFKRHIQPQKAPTWSQDPFSEPDPIKTWHGPVPAFPLLIVSPFGLLPQCFASAVCFLHERVSWIVRSKYRGDKRLFWCRFFSPFFPPPADKQTRSPPPEAPPPSTQRPRRDVSACVSRSEF